METTTSNTVLNQEWIVGQDAPAYRQPSGKVSVLQDKFNTLLKLAKKTIVKSSANLPILQCVILTAEPGELLQQRGMLANGGRTVGALTAEVWGADGFVKVGEIGAKVENGFRCAVYLDTLSALVNLLPAERIDIVYDCNADVRNPFKVTCARSISNLPAFTEKDCPNGVTREQLQLTKEQTAEVAWLKRATDKNDSRPVLRYIHHADGVLMANDGYRMHIVSDYRVPSHTYSVCDNLPEWIDVHNQGQPEAGTTYPDMTAYLSASGETVAVKSSTWKEKVWNGKTYANKTFSKSLLQSVKTVAGKGKGVVWVELTTDEQTNELVVTATADNFYGDKASDSQGRIAYSGAGFIHSQKYQAQYLIDALSGMAGEMVWITQAGNGKGHWLIISDHQGHTAVVVAGVQDKPQAPAPQPAETTVAISATVVQPVEDDKMAFVCETSIKIGHSIRIHGRRLNLPFDQTFKIGDQADTGHCSMGKIVAITDKLITLEGRCSSKRIKIDAFALFNAEPDYTSDEPDEDSHEETIPCVAIEETAPQPEHWYARSLRQVAANYATSNYAQPAVTNNPPQEEIKTMNTPQYPIRPGDVLAMSGHGQNWQAYAWLIEGNVVHVIRPLTGGDMKQTQGYYLRPDELRKYNAHVIGYIDPECFRANHLPFHATLSNPALPAFTPFVPALPLLPANVPTAPAQNG